MNKIQKILTFGIMLVLLVSSIASTGIGIANGSATQNEESQSSQTKDDESSDDGETLEMFVVSYHWDIKLGSLNAFVHHELELTPTGNYINGEPTYYITRDMVIVDILDDITDDICFGIDTKLILEYFLWKKLNPDTPPEIPTESKVSNEIDREGNLVLHVTIEQRRMPIMMNEIAEDVPMQPVDVEDFPESPMDLMPIDMESAETEQMPMQGQTPLQTISYEGETEMSEEHESLCDGSSGGLFENFWYNFWIYDTCVEMDGTPLGGNPRRNYLRGDYDVDPSDYIDQWFTINDLNPDANLPEDEDQVVYGVGCVDHNYHDFVIKTDGMKKGEQEVEIFHNFALLIYNFAVWPDAPDSISIIFRFNYAGGDSDNDDPEEDEKRDEPDHSKNPGSAEPGSHEESKDELGDEPGEELNLVGILSSLRDRLRDREITIIEAIHEAIQQIISLILGK